MSNGVGASQTNRWATTFAFVVYSAATSRMDWRRSPISAHTFTIWAPNWIVLNKSRTKNEGNCWTCVRFCEARPILSGSRWEMPPQQLSLDVFYLFCVDSCRIWPPIKAPATHCISCKATKITASQNRVICWRRAKAKCDACGRSDDAA